MLTKERIGAAVRGLRNAKGFTIEELADIANIDRGNLSRMERGLGGFSLEALCRIAKTFGVTVSDIMAAAELEQREPDAAQIIEKILAMPEEQRKNLAKFLGTLN
jgi:transcriptional regulator with XRE-family HTH domain